VRPLTCAACGQTLTHAIWDKLTEQVYCDRCIPPLPQPLGRNITSRGPMNTSLRTGWARKRSDEEEDEKILEPQDSPCECCGRASPRLFFDTRSQLLLCPRCFKGMRELVSRQPFRKSA